jgi:hypothetical protein
MDNEMNSNLINKIKFQNQTSVFKSKLLIFLFFFLFTVIFLNFLPKEVSAQSKLNCSICRETISGKYWTYGNKKVVCNKCYTNLPKCSRCGFPSQNLFTVENNSVCKECHDKFPKCSRCSRAMVNYWKYTGTDGNAMILCKDCSVHIAPRCLLCNSTLQGKRYWHLVSSSMDREGYYCESCRTAGKSCFSCGLLTRPDSPTLAGNRRICNYCRKHSLKTEAEYRQVLRIVDGIFKEKLGLYHRQVHDFKIVDLQTLNVLRIQQRNLMPNIPGENLGLFVSRKKHIKSGDGKTRVISEPGTIYVLDNLPPEIAYAVVAHEYAHAWYEERVQKHKDPVIVEGFAEWAAYHVLLDRKMDNSAEKMKNNDTIYGRGLKMMLDYEKQRGRRALLEYVTSD